MGLKPWEFEKLQPQELYKMLDAQRERDKAIDSRLSYFVYWIAAPHITSEAKVSPQSIYEGLHPTPKHVRDEEKKKELQSLREEFNLSEQGGENNG